MQDPVADHDPQLGPLSEPIAAQIVVHARLARPLAVTVAAAASLGAGAWLTVLLAVAIDPSSGGERALIGVIGVAAIAGVAFVLVRALRPSWGSAPALIRHIQPASRALVAGGLTFGALELVATSTAAVLGPPTLGLGIRIVLAGLAAGVGLGWQRLRLDERLQRRLG